MVKNSKDKDKGNGHDSKMVPDLGKIKKEMMSKKRIVKKDIAEEIEAKELVSEAEELRVEREEWKKVEDDLNDRIKRLQADYDNFRKRAAKQNLEYMKRANKDLISKILPIIDNLEMALGAAKGMGEKEESLYKGVKMIYNNLLELLKKENVTVIEPEGKEFDPKLCHAAVTEAVVDIEEDTVLEILRKGYMIDDFVIRPAVVKVCKKN